MGLSTDTVLVFLVLTAFVLLGSSRLMRHIRLVATQGMLLALLTLAVSAHGITPRVAALAAATAALKGAAFPWLLARVLRAADVRREVEPFVGYNLSLLIGGLMLPVAFALSARLPLPSPPASPLLVPTSLFLTLVGLFVIVSRRKALTQVLGYLVLENGIYVFGIGPGEGTPMVVELGVLLDVFVAVFVMGIAIFHINREFDHIDADRLATLHDWAP